MELSGPKKAGSILRIFFSTIFYYNCHVPLFVKLVLVLVFAYIYCTGSFGRTLIYKHSELFCFDIGI